MSDMITAAIASVGVVLVAKPTFIFGGLVGQKSNLESIAVVVSIIAALLTALVSVQVRKPDFDLN
jgi:drug/metabolite transporter (DMT)-like permease